MKEFFIDNYVFFGFFALLILFAIIGWFRGFVSMSMGIVSLICSIIITSIFSKGFVNFLIENTQLKSYIMELIVDSGKSISDGTSNSSFLFGLFGNKDASSSIYDFAESFANGTIRVIGVIVFFLVIFIAFKLVSKLFEKAAEAPIIKKLNSFFGLVFGVIECLMLVWLIFIIMGWIPSGTIKENFELQIQNSSLLKFIYDNNLISYVFVLIFGKQ